MADKLFDICLLYTSFDQDGVSDAFFDTFFQDLGVGYEQVVTNQLDFVAQNFGLVCETVQMCIRDRSTGL